MIFKPELAERVMARRKTRTFRPGVQRYFVGKTYAVQPGRGKFSIGRVQVTKAEACIAGDITGAEARREGFSTPRHFVEYLMALYNGTWDEARSMEGWGYTFKVVQDGR